jgi:hypothetical protein
MKKLTLREIHSLYLLLRSSLPQKQETYLIDEIDKMIGMMESGETLIQAVEILYPKKKINKNNSIELLTLLVRGLKENEFFGYVEFINGIKRGRRPSKI